MEICSEKYGNNGWLGLAQIWISSSHITQGVVKLNDTYFNTTKYNTAPWRNLVMCQEVGHTFGLDLQDETFDTEMGSDLLRLNNLSRWVGKKKRMIYGVEVQAVLFDFKRDEPC